MPFRIDYVNTVKAPENIRDAQVANIDTESAMSAPERITKVASYVLEHFNQKTNRKHCYAHNGKQVTGFNSIFAAPSIAVACQYYAEFKRQLQESDEHLKIAMIYSFAVNGEEGETQARPNQTVYKKSVLQWHTQDNRHGD